MTDRIYERLDEILALREYEVIDWVLTDDILAYVGTVSKQEKDV